MSKRNSCTSLRPTENCGWTSVAELRAQQGRKPQGPSSAPARPLGGGGWLAPARRSRPQPGAQRRDAGPCHQRRHPHPRRRRRPPPPSPPPLRVTSRGWRGPPVDSVVFPFFKFRPGMKLARRGGTRMWSGEPALGPSRSKSGAKEDAGRKRSRIRFELVLT